MYQYGNGSDADWHGRTDRLHQSQSQFLCKGEPHHHDDPPARYEYGRECRTLSARALSLNFVSKEQALKEGTRELGANPAEFAGENPFTGEIEIQLKANYANNDSIRNVVQELRTYRGVSDITYPQSLVESVNHTLGKISLVLLVIAVLLTIVSFSLINNTIRLSIYARRFSIHTMKLVGASWNFIRAPFLRRAVLEGLVSALLAIVVLGVGICFLYDYEPDITKVLSWGALVITAAVMLAFGVLIAVFCSWLSVNRFLRMKAGDLYKI